VSTVDEENEYAVIGSWGVSPYKKLVTPSGQSALVKVLSMEDLLSLGLARDTDTLTAIAGEAVDAARAPADRKTKKPTKAQEAAAAEKASRDLVESPEGMQKFAGLITKVLVAAVIKPKINVPPTKTVNGEEVPDLEARRIGAVYADSIGFDDKMAVFNYAMSGTVKAEPFREGSDPDVGNVEHVKTVQLPSESTPVDHE
jgi:hypothetical protein